MPGTHANTVRWNGRGLGVLGDDNSTLLDLGFNSLQIQQIMSAHQSGALSDGGYQALVSGYISPDDLAAFMAADPGATGTVTTSGTAVPISNVNVPLTTGPSPVVAAPSASLFGANPLAWFSQSTLIGGMAIPNVALVAVPLLLIAATGGGYAYARGRR